MNISSKDLEQLSHKQQVQFALFCCYQIKEHWESIPEAVECTEVVERWLVGKASSEECRVAAYAAAANKERVVREQREWIEDTLNLDKNFEEIVLGS